MCPTKCGDRGKISTRDKSLATRTLSFALFPHIINPTTTIIAITLTHIPTVRSTVRANHTRITELPRSTGITITLKSSILSGAIALPFTTTLHAG